MNTLLVNLESLLLSPAGSMLYHLVILFTIVICLQLTLAPNKSQPSTNSRKIRTGLYLLLAYEIAILAVLALTTQGIIEERSYLPVINRWISTAILATLIWLWVSTQKTRVITLVFAIVQVILLLVCTFSLWAWGQQFNTGFFNQTDLDWLWGFINVGLLLTGLFLLALQRNTGWLIGFVLFLLNLAAQNIHIFLYAPSADISAINRLALLLVFPFLPSLINTAALGSRPTMPKAARQSPTPSLNRHIRTLTQTDPKSFLEKIPEFTQTFSAAEQVFIISTDKTYPEVSFSRANEQHQQEIVRIHRERIPETLHATEGQFILAYNNVPAFKDEFSRIAPNLEVNPSSVPAIFPYPISPEHKHSLLLLFPPASHFDDVKQSEIAATISSLMLLLHQKQREEQLQQSIDRLKQNNQNHIRPISSINFQLLQQELAEMHALNEQLAQEKNALQDDLISLTNRIQVDADRLDEVTVSQSLAVLNNWLSRAQTENGILQARVAQLAAERESLQFELDHYSESKHLSEHYAYLQPQEAMPLDDRTRLNETLARAKEFLFSISETNELIEHNQVQGVVLLESIQEQLGNINQLKEKPDEEVSFITQAEFFLEDLRATQSIFREQMRLHKLLEETFSHTMQMKDKFDSLTNINQHNYIRINDLFTTMETYRSKNEETDLILRNMQEENEQLRTGLMQALAQTKGDEITIENMQSELITALEEINLLRERIDQDQDRLHHLNLQDEMTSEGIKENNQAIITLLQDMLKPLSSITSCADLLRNEFADNQSIQHLSGQIFESINRLQEYVSELITATDRNLALISIPDNVFQDTINAPSTDDPPEKLFNK
jgi:hypothetical protein